MKQPNHSGTPVDPNLESSTSSEIVRKSFLLRLLRGKIVKGTLIVLSVAFFITVYLLANRRNRANGESIEYLPMVNNQSLKVEVLDGAGSMRAAQQMTNILRSRGYDVVEMKKINGEDEERTFIFDRSGNMESVSKLATILGVSRDKVFQKIDRTLYLDITVVLGKDYSRLKVFQSTNERNNH